MILSGKKIIEEVRNENIIIYPFEESCVNPNSYNYHLGNELIIVRELDLELNRAKDAVNVTVPHTGYTLYPDTLYLASTFETIGSNKYASSLIGRSSMGRLGLFLQISANLGHQTIHHKWTLELKCCMPITIYPGQVIGQVSFWIATGAVLDYNGNYATFDSAKLSDGVVF